MPTLYEKDYYCWAMSTAAALREGRTQDLELDAIAEELEDLGRSEKRSLRSAIVRLFMHVLKIRYQPGEHTASWDASVKSQRDELQEAIEDNPSLRPLLTDGEFIARAYRRAVNEAVKETGLPESTFPDECPFGYEEFGL
jgi:hypothetical protein